LLTSDGDTENKVAKAVPFGLLLVVILVLFGRYSYSTDIAGGLYEIDVTLASEDKTGVHPQPAHIVRAVDEGIFLVLQSAPGNLAFVKKDTVKMLSKKIEK
jgi:hypothetical protein